MSLSAFLPKVVISFLFLTSGMRVLARNTSAMLSMLLKFLFHLLVLLTRLLICILTSFYLLDVTDVNDLVFYYESLLAS